MMILPSQETETIHSCCVQAETSRAMCDDQVNSLERTLPRRETLGEPPAERHGRDTNPYNVIV